MPKKSIHSFGEDSNNKETLKKRRQRLKSLILDHYGNRVTFIGEKTGTDLLINSDNLQTNLVLRTNEDSII